ncbi:MAG TPA: acyl-CoA dehydrogenase family protein, partial [Acidimicrobiales bacterium]|nr:acyl-CoA dehydrogenase family protein [Acidimicrobiales bacterium]
RPIVQLTGSAEFNEIFFTDARTPAAFVVGGVNEGWRVAMGLLAFERGLSTLGQQLAFQRDFDAVIAAAKANGRSAERDFRQRAAELWSRLQIMRWNTLRTLGGTDRPELSGAAYISKLFWSHLHQDLGELFIDTVGAEAMLIDGDPPGLSHAQRLYLATRAETIYGGTSQIQRNIIAERALGLPREPRP